MEGFFDMGGYAAFIWPAYGLAALVMIGLLAASIKNARAREGELSVLQQMRRPRRGATPEN